MTPTEAAKLLEVAPDATPEQLEARFLDLRRKLEDKIAKAPTPGLQAKYRESLAEITTAFETLTLAADGSALPVLQRQRTEDRGRKTAGGPSSREAAATGGGMPAPREASAKPAAAKKSSSKEFLIVAVIAVVVLGAGGWFVMKTRAEKAELVRLATEARIAADLKAAAEKTEAENKRKADDEEKVRVAAAAKTEQERREQVIAQQRARLAHLNVNAEALFKEEPARAARRLGELKSDERSSNRSVENGTARKLRAQLNAQQDYVDALEALLARHPARSTQAQATEFLSSHAIEATEESLVLLDKQLEQADAQIKEARRQVDQAIYGTLQVECPFPETQWTFTDIYDQVRSGQSSQSIAEVGIGAGTIEFKRPGWPVLTRTVQIQRSSPAKVVGDFLPAHLALSAVSAGATYRLSNGAAGSLPAELELIPGRYTVTVVAVVDDDRQKWTQEVELQMGESKSLQAKLARTPLWTNDEADIIDQVYKKLDSINGLAYHSEIVVLSGEDRDEVSAVVSSSMPLKLVAPPLAPPPASTLRNNPGTPLVMDIGMVLKGKWNSYPVPYPVVAKIAAPRDLTLRANCGGLVYLVGLVNPQTGAWTLKPDVYATSHPELALRAQQWAESARAKLTGPPPDVYPYYTVAICIKFRAPEPQAGSPAPTSDRKN